MGACMSIDNVVEMTRQELHDRVWTTPMRTLAGEWGLSDVGLAKICQKHLIPRPPQGHWARKRNGHRVRRQPLPPIEDDRLQTIRIECSGGREEPHVANPEIASLILRESDPKWALTVGDRLRLQHPVVKATKESVKESHPDKYGRVSPSWGFSEPHFDLCVSPRNVSRALRILEALTSAMRDRGFPLTEKLVGSRRHSCFDVLGEEFQIALRESSKRSKREPEKSSSYRWSSERYDYTPTGVLELCINYGSYSSDARLRDTKQKQLECRLNEAIIAMLRVADLRKKRAEAARLEAIRKAERKSIAVEEEIKRRSDTARVARLARLAQQWEVHQRYNAFVDAVRAEVASCGFESDPDTLDWLTWADAFLREIDPLAGGADLPGYALTEEEREQLREECEADWSDWTQTFRSRQPATASAMAVHLLDACT